MHIDIEEDDYSDEGTDLHYRAIPSWCNDEGHGTTIVEALEDLVEQLKKG